MACLTENMNHSMNSLNSNSIFCGLVNLDYLFRKFLFTRNSLLITRIKSFVFITARKRSLRRLCFHRCLSVHRGVSAPLHALIHTPPGQVHPPGQVTPRQVHPQCMLGYTPTPLHSACCDTVNKWAVRIQLECILVPAGFWSTPGSEE